MKTNKLLVAVHADPVVRQKILKQLIIECGFALTPSDAGKMIRSSVFDIDLTNAYFVIADNYNFRESPITQARLYELAARGIAVILGSRKLPPEYEFICQARYQ